MTDREYHDHRQQFKAFLQDLRLRFSFTPEMEEDIASIFNKKHGYDFCNYVDYFSKLIVDIGNVRKWKTAKNNMTVPGGTKYVQHILGWIEGYVGTPVKMGILYLFFEDKGVSKELLGLKIGTF